MKTLDIRYKANNASIRLSRMYPLHSAPPHAHVRSLLELPVPVKKIGTLVKPQIHQSSVVKINMHVLIFAIFFCRKYEYEDHSFVNSQFQLN